MFQGALARSYFRTVEFSLAIRRQRRQGGSIVDFLGIDAELADFTRESFFVLPGDRHLHREPLQGWEGGFLLGSKNFYTPQGEMSIIKKIKSFNLFFLRFAHNKRK